MIEGCTIDKNADILKISQLSFHKNQLAELDNISIHYGEKVIEWRIQVKTAQENQVSSNEYSPTILVVEHDSEFCKNIATKIIEL